MNNDNDNNNEEHIFNIYQWIIFISSNTLLLLFCVVLGINATRKRNANAREQFLMNILKQYNKAGDSNISKLMKVNSEQSLTKSYTFDSNVL